MHVLAITMAASRSVKGMKARPSATGGGKESASSGMRKMTDTVIEYVWERSGVQRP